MLPSTLLYFVPLFAFAAALNNNLARTPQMGYNSWYDVYMTPSEQGLRDTVSALKRFGFYAAGYRYVNLDDGMVSSRTADGRLQPDAKFFPSGFKAIADYIHSEGMLFGVYTDRGTSTCGGRPAAQGYEAIDAATYASWGVDYVKEDSCNAPQDHQTAYKQYSLMRDALNATGRAIFFSLCGWENWYAPVGRNLGNSWRIGPDDTNWDGILSNIDINSNLWPYAGPGGWNDPCLLLGRDSKGQPAVTDQQGRAQFTMWAIMASPMLLSQNVRNMTQFQLQTYLNLEVIAVGQDSLGRQGQRLVGGNLSVKKKRATSDPAITLQTCNGQGLSQKWTLNSPENLFIESVDTKLCVNVNDCGTELIGYDCVTSGGTCAGPNSYSNEQFQFSSGGTLKSLLGGNLCVTHSGLGYGVIISQCRGTSNQVWQYNTGSGTIQSATGGCLTLGGPLGSRANIWGRPLNDGSWAIAFINADSVPVTLICGSECLSVTGWDADQVLLVRDLWQYKNLPQTTPANGVSATLDPNGGVSLFKLTPVYK